jgi:hypothetical protein
MVRENGGEGCGTENVGAFVYVIVELSGRDLREKKKSGL